MDMTTVLLVLLGVVFIILSGFSIASLIILTKAIKRQNEISERQNELLERQAKILEKQLAVASPPAEKSFSAENELKTKRMLAREGLIIAGLCAAGALGGVYYLYKLNANSLSFAIISDNPGYLVLGALKAVAMAYPVYLLLRFIVWAVNAVKKK